MDGSFYYVPFISSLLLPEECFQLRYNRIKTLSSYEGRYAAWATKRKRGGVILIGDAAEVEPAAFREGIHLALSYSEVAAEAIINAFRKDDFIFHDYHKRIQSHSVEGFIAKRIRLALAINDSKMNPLEEAREVFYPRM
jgi:hypothetical protein